MYPGARHEKVPSIREDPANEEDRLAEEWSRLVPGLTGGQTPDKRLVLGYDGGCSACSELARRIGARLEGKLEVLSLHEPRVQEWRKSTLGEDAPLAPTLFEVRGDGAVRAWTGWRLGANLGRFLGPADTWRVLQALDEVGGASEGAGPEGPAGRSQAPGGLTRGQFLKGVGGAAVAMSVLSGTGKLASPVVAQSTGSSTSSSDEVVGATIAHPAEFVVEREQFTFDDTYGFTVWKPKSGSSRDAHDHGETTPALRVARARKLRPKEIERKVRARIAEHPDLSMKRVEVSVGAKGYEGVAIGPIPGSTPSTEVYVPVEDRVYQVNVYGEKLDKESRRLLKRVRFDRPARSIESLELADGKKAETHQKEGETGLVEAEQAARETELKAEALDEMVAAAASGEYRTSEGCWVADSTFFFQTQHGKYANRRWGSTWTGWTQIGNPNYWGQYTHGNYGYGRCNSTYYTNDMYAIDYPLAKGDVVFSPFKGGTVTFAGRNYSHKNYGIFVVIKADNGKYVSMSAHLSGLASGIRRGAYVTNKTVIGYAGDTGDPSIPVGPPHLHQAFYRYPSYRSDGSPYGGAGLQVTNHRYTGTAARQAGYTYSSGMYRYGWTTANYNATCREGIKCGEGYAISN